MSSPAPKNIREEIQHHIFYMQDKIVQALESLDPGAPPFKRDIWRNPESGHGRSFVFPSARQDISHVAQRPTLLERGNVNASIIEGVLPPKPVRHMCQMPLPTPEKGLPFFAAALSLVIHPANPHAPTVHFNYRFFEITLDGVDAERVEADKVPMWWFGGGGDLTPHYLYEEDAVDFHRVFKDTCDPFGKVLFPTFKKWCDDYFYIRHRGEARGIGGIFFDNLSDLPHDKIPDDSTVQRPRTADEIFKFVRNVGEAFLPAYIPILERRMSLPITPRQYHWQRLRHGRYVEFNLVIDSGVKFGLNAPGVRVEDLMMSLPETAQWEYMSTMGTEEGTEEWKLVKVLKTPREWV